MNNFSKIWK